MKDTKNQLKALEAELARQDAQLEELTHQLNALGDVAIEVPEGFFESIDALMEEAAVATSVAPPACNQPPIHAIRA